MVVQLALPYDRANTNTADSILTETKDSTVRWQANNINKPGRATVCVTQSRRFKGQIRGERITSRGFEALNVTWLLEPQEEVCSRSKFRGTMATKQSRSTLVFVRRKVRQETKQWGLKSSSAEWIELDVVDRYSVNKKRMDANAESLGTSAFTGNDWDKVPSTRMEMVSVAKKIDFHHRRDKGDADENSFVKRPTCQIRSKAFEMSNKIIYASPWFLSAADQD